MKYGDVWALADRLCEMPRVKKSIIRSRLIGPRVGAGDKRASFCSALVEFAI